MKMGARPRAQTNSAASGAQERTSRGDAGKRNKKRRAFFSRGRMDAPGRMSGALMAPLWGAFRALTKPTTAKIAPMKKEIRSNFCFRRQQTCILRSLTSM